MLLLLSGVIYNRNCVSFWNQIRHCALNMDSDVCNFNVYGG